MRSKYFDNTDIFKIRKAFHKKHMSDLAHGDTVGKDDDSHLPADNCRPTFGDKYMKKMFFEEVGEDYQGGSNQNKWSYDE